MSNYFSKKEIQLQGGLDEEALLSSSELARLQTGSESSFYFFITLLKVLRMIAFNEV